MLASIPYLIIVLIVLVGVFRIIRIKNNPKPRIPYSRVIYDTFMLLIIYGVLFMLGANMYLTKTTNVYAKYETVPLESIKVTVQLPKEGENIYLQATHPGSNTERGSYYLIKVNSRKMKINIYDTTVNYRPTEPKVIVKSLRVRNSKLAKVLHVSDKLQAVSYQVFIQDTNADLATTPYAEDYTEYPAP